MEHNSENPLVTGPTNESVEAARDLAALSSVEILSLHGVDMLTAGAIKLGLFEGTTPDLAEARIIINALAGFIDAAAPELGSHHAAPLRDGLQTLQRSFKEQSTHPDAPGAGPGEKYTGPVYLKTN
jgi:hypothetical protein